MLLEVKWTFVCVCESDGPIGLVKDVIRKQQKQGLIKRSQQQAIIQVQNQDVHSFIHLYT